MLKKRSLTIAGHRTSVSLEPAFWTALTQVANLRGCSLNELISQIDKERSHSLASALRLFVLEEMGKQKTKCESLEK